MLEIKDIDLIINLLQRVKIEGLPCQKNGSFLDLHKNCRYPCFLKTHVTWNFNKIGKFYVENLTLCFLLKDAVHEFVENEESLRKKE